MTNKMDLCEGVLGKWFAGNVTEDFDLSMVVGFHFVLMFYLTGISF